MDPCFLVCFVDVLLNLLVEEGEPGVSGRVSTNGVALADEAFGGIREVRDHIRYIAFGDE